MFRQPGANETSEGSDLDSDYDPLSLQDGPLGIDVCLTCFNGGCLDPDRHHALTHYEKTGHRFALNVKRRRKPSSKRVHFCFTFATTVQANTADGG